jgi:hypothetical protein
VLGKSDRRQNFFVCRGIRNKDGRKQLIVSTLPLQAVANGPSEPKYRRYCYCVSSSGPVSSSRPGRHISSLEMWLAHKHSQPAKALVLEAIRSRSQRQQTEHTTASPYRCRAEDSRPLKQKRHQLVDPAKVGYRSGDCRGDCLASRAFRGWCCKVPHNNSLMVEQRIRDDLDWCARRSGHLCHRNWIGQDWRRPVDGSPSIRRRLGLASQLELLLTSLPQHSGRSGRLERSHPPPRAWISKTVFAIRRPRILTAVTSSPRAAF